MVMVLMLIVMFVMRPAVTEPHFPGEPGIRQEFQCPIDGGLSDGWIFIVHQSIEIVSRDMLFGTQKDIEYQIALGRAFQALFLNVLVKDFLLFVHSMVVGHRTVEKTKAFYTEHAAQRNQ